MATINHAVNVTSRDGWYVVLWETMGNADDGEAWELTGQPGDLVAQAIGTFGSATVKMQGSNDGTNWFDMVDPQGTAIGLTAAGAASLGSAPRYVRPNTSGGTGTDVDVYFLVRQVPS